MSAAAVPNLGSRIFLITALSFLLAVEASAQIIDLRVKGVGIGSNYTTAIGKLGRPISEIRRGTAPCGGGPVRTLRYNGLVLRLETGDERPLGTYKVQVTSPRWAVSGIRFGTRKARNVSTIRVGVPKARIISKFGSGHEGRNERGRFLSYWIEDGWCTFYLGGSGSVKMIEWEFNFC